MLDKIGESDLIVLEDSLNYFRLSWMAAFSFVFVIHQLAAISRQNEGNLVDNTFQMENHIAAIRGTIDALNSLDDSVSEGNIKSPEIIAQRM